MWWVDRGGLGRGRLLRFVVCLKEDAFAENTADASLCARVRKRGFLRFAPHGDPLKPGKIDESF